MFKGLKGDIQDARLLYLKGALFALIALMAGAGILAELPSWRVALLLVLALWSACRFYYFLFYVIEKYADPSFRFAGLTSALLYFWNRRKEAPGSSPRDEA
jgi:hypothetical protein